MRKAAPQRDFSQTIAAHRPEARSPSVSKHTLFYAVSTLQIDTHLSKTLGPPALLPTDEASGTANS